MDGFLIIANIIFIILLLISSLLTIISLPGNIVKSILVCKFLGYHFVVNHPA